MKVIDFKAVKAATNHQRYANKVLDAYDRIERDIKRARDEKSSAVRRKARKSF